jgi:hypothetical protein
MRGAVPVEIHVQSQARPGPGEPSRSEQGSGARDALAVAGFLIALVAYLLLVGWLVDWVRLSAARLPAPLAADAYGPARLLGDGLRSTALAGAVFALLCALAYLVSALHWSRNRRGWHRLVNEHGVRRAQAAVARDADRAGHPDGTAAAAGAQQAPAPLGEAAVRILAGSNTVAIAALLALVPARLPDALGAPWWGIALTWTVVFTIVCLLLTRLDPLDWPARLHGLVWALAVVVAIFASAPFGLVVLASVLVATCGRAIARLPQPRSVGQWARSPLPWALLAVVTLVALAYQAMPPVSFPTATLTTAAGARTAGYVARSGAGVYLASCASQLDARSTGERLSLVPSAEVKGLTVVSQSYRFDSGQRPSLATLAMHAVGIGGDAPTLLDADLRSRAETCGGEGTGIVSNFPSLGSGVLVGPGPVHGRAADGEAPIQATSPAPIATLARRFQPTLEVTVADRFWPVSLGAVLAELGAGGERACLVQRRAPRQLCTPSPTSLVAAGADRADYLQLPARLARESSPDRQFAAFMRGRMIDPGPASRWLADPAKLDPWDSAEIYFYLAPRIATRQWPAKARNPLVPSGLLGLEYWFYYPYNYYPAVVQPKLMQATPLAGDRLDVDLHQGDWEHVDVLLDPHTLKPLWLYMARHGFEGRFEPWSSVTLDDGHPVVQAAYGGHPTYPPGCGAQPRAVTRDFLADWLVCGSGRFAFRGASTPLVDLAATGWGCWPGHFGEAATAAELANAAKPESVLDRARKLLLFVAGPLSPLQQAENTGVCRRDPRAGELAALGRLRGP